MGSHECTGFVGLVVLVEVVVADIGLMVGYNVW